MIPLQDSQRIWTEIFVSSAKCACVQAGVQFEGTIHASLLMARWQLPTLPADKAALAAWPRQLLHASCRLFATQADVAAAHEAAPRWHLHGDYKCMSDSSVAVSVFEQGREHLHTIAQMQRELVCFVFCTICGQVLHALEHQV